MTTIEQLAGITSQHNEIVKRVSNGSLNPTAVKRALQDIIEGKLPAVANRNPPTWWRTPEQQFERARQLWPNIVLPEPPNRTGISLLKLLHKYAHNDTAIIYNAVCFYKLTIAECFQKKRKRYTFVKQIIS